MKRIGKICSVLFLLMVTTCCTTGCWDYREMDKDADVEALAYDISNDGEAEITAEIPKFNHTTTATGGQSGQGDIAREIISAEGPTFYEAIEHLADRVPTTLTFTHHETSIFSEEMAKSKLFSNVLDRIIRVGEIRRRAQLFVTSGRAQDVLTSDMYLAATIGEGLKGIVQKSQDQQSSPKVDLNEFLYELTSPGINPSLPRLVVSHNGATDEDEIRFTGTAAFKGKQFAGWLDEDETRGVLWAKGKSGHPVFSFPWKGERVIVKTQQMKGKIKLVSQQNRPQYVVNLRWKGAISMYSGKESIPLNELPSVEAAVSQYIRDIVTHTIEKLQHMETDIIGFGNVLYIQNPQTFRKQYGLRWHTVGFPKIKVQVAVKSTITNTGYTKEPVEVR